MYHTQKSTDIVSSKLRNSLIVPSSYWHLGSKVRSKFQTNWAIVMYRVGHDKAIFSFCNDFLFHFWTKLSEIPIWNLEQFRCHFKFWQKTFSRVNHSWDTIKIDSCLMSILSVVNLNGSHFCQHLIGGFMKVSLVIHEFWRNQSHGWEKLERYRAICWM